MALALRRIKVYCKLGATLAAVGSVLLIALMNLSRTSNVWFFHEYKEVPTFWLILVTAVSAIVGWWGVFKVVGVIRDLREMRASRAAERQREDQRRQAQELADREKRIDEKLRRSITDGNG